MELFHNPFKLMSLEKLKQYESIYVDLLAKQQDNYVPPLMRNGKPMKIYKMKWMVPVWTKGLEMVRAEIKEVQSNLKILSRAQ